ncbi:MAG: hypothetical protein HN737_02645 [Desulfobacterales bacterium]|nr:hypothetical protein [Desulfobacterales bacterium]
MGNNKYEHLVVKSPVDVGELPDHTRDESIPFRVSMGSALVPEAKAWALYGFNDEITPEFMEVMSEFKATPHKHDYDEMYLMVGQEGALTFEVMLGDEFYEIPTPGAVYIPKDLPHAIRPIKATVGLAGGVIPVCLSGEYKTLPV